MSEQSRQSEQGVQTYLWDRNGPCDPFVVRIECLLSEKRARVERAGQLDGHRWRARVLWLAGVAVAAAAGVVIWVCLGRTGTGTRAPVPRVAIEADARHVPPSSIPNSNGLNSGGSLDSKSVEPKPSAAGEPALDAARPATTDSLRPDAR
jgi:hypothetical protein